MHASSTDTRPRRRWRGPRIAAAAAVAIGCVTLGTAGPATATETRDWDGVDPRGTTCNTDARTVASAAITFEGHRLGSIELRYSSSCRTAWARLHNDMDHVPGDAHSGYADIVRDSDGLTFSCWSPPGPDTVCWTKMVDDAGTTAHAFGDIDPYPTHGYGEASARTKSY